MVYTFKNSEEAQHFAITFRIWGIPCEVKDNTVYMNEDVDPVLVKAIARIAYASQEAA